jgi:hypothetical protein
MDYKEFKEYMIDEAVIVGSTLAVKLIKVLVVVFKKKMSPDELKNCADCNMYWVTVPSHHVRVISIKDDMGEEEFLLAKPKGFFKKWEAINKSAIPAILRDKIFDKASSKAERKRLLKKALGLKAFW